MTEGTADWAEVAVGDIADGIYDGPHATPKLTEAGPTFLGISSLVNGRLDLTQSGSISEEDFARWTRRVTPQVGDLVFSYETRLGEAALIPEGLKCCLGRRLALIRPKRSVILPEFLLYSYLSPRFQEEIRRYTVHGSTVNRIALTQFPSFQMLLPPLEEQKSIAGVLGALDDKIETNRRLIRKLDELYMTECAAALSISSEDVSLGKIASLSLGGTPSKDNASFWEGGNIPWINSGRLHEFPVLTPSDFITPEGLSKSATKLIPKGSTVVAITGATLGVVSRLAIDTTINQSIVAVECRENVVLNSFMLYALRANMAELVSSATGAAQQHVNKANFEELVVSIPASEGDGLLQNIPNLLGQIDVLAQENITLSLMRNALLPELLSGRLRVKDAESIVENV